jgi:hypothetical protein
VKETCAHCKFFRVSTTNAWKSDGYCWRHAPTVHTVRYDDGGGETCSPYVQASDSCGDFVPKRKPRAAKEATP